MCTRSHVLPHPVAVPFQQHVATLLHICIPPPPVCCFIAFSFEAPCVCVQMSRAVVGCLPACASCLGPAPLTFAEFTDLSLILLWFVCRLCPASQHTELSLYSYCPLTWGCLAPRTHPLPLYTSIQPSRQLSALGPLTLPGGLTLR